MSPMGAQMMVEDGVAHAFIPSSSICENLRHLWTKAFLPTVFEFQRHEGAT